MEGVRYVVTTWGADRQLLQAVRRQVFIVEQSIPEPEEWDDEDVVSVHVLATLKREPVGTGRLSPTGKIGRLAVISELRGQGVGARLLGLLLGEAVQRGMPEVYLHAQVHAVPFYEKAGFQAQGAVFDEAGIPHLRMRRFLG
jgi:predicted GNAT family N-acyltransferase